MLSWLLRTVPWTMLLRHAPKAVGAARTLYDATHRSSPRPEPRGHTSREELDRMFDAIDRLEEHVAQQAEMVADLARRVQALTTAVEVLRTRLAVVMVVGGALLVVLLVLVLALWGRTS